MTTCETTLKDLDFIGGTFVEYIKGTDQEFGRGVIATFECKGNHLVIETEDSIKAKFKLGIAHLDSSDCTITRCFNNIWEIQTGPYLGWLCAIAPKGVEIS